MPHGPVMYITMKKAVARGSCFVARKSSPSFRMGCGQISQRAAQGSLYRGADRQRRSERLNIGPYAQGRWPCFLRIAELWQPTFISSPVCDIVGDAQRAYRYGDSAKCCAEKTLFAGPGRGVFYELRVTRSDVVSLSLLPRSGIRRGRPVKASRYALRVSRSVVVSLSLSRRNAASESEKKAVVRGSWFVARKTMPHGPVMYITIYSRRAALWDGPYDAAIRPQKRATNH